MLTLRRWLLHRALHLCRFLLRCLGPEYRPRWPSPRTGGPLRRPHAAPKPDWVRREIIRLKALLLEAGCRTIANCFNRRFAARRGMTVGKTYVADTIRRHQYAILVARRKLKHAAPRPVPRNLIWGLDLLVTTDTQGKQHLAVAILDHASRACLILQALSRKSTLALLRFVMHTVRRYGTPTYVRTDNEAVFTARLFSLGLRALGIRHQRTAPGCPWQNGRVERFIGTVKAALEPCPVVDGTHPGTALHQVRWWYNHVRPHDNLQGRTPAEVWAGIDVFAPTHDASRCVKHWSATWRGVLREITAR